MRNIILLLAFILISTVHAGTCTSISRTNSASLSVLTSTKYNTDLNTVYTAANAFDGGCVTSGTLESDALNTTQFAPLLKGLHQGCKVIYSSASTVQIDKCLASVNGNFVTTTTTTNAAFGCSGCSAEVVSTTYYVYIQTGSTGSTLTPLILTTAPNNDGYDNSGNKVLARFYNNASSNIDQYSIDQWHNNKFIAQDTGWVNSGAMTIGAVTTAPTKGTMNRDRLWFKREGKNAVFRVEYDQTALGSSAAGSGDYLLTLPLDFKTDSSFADFYTGGVTFADASWGFLTREGKLYLTTDSGGGLSAKGTIIPYDNGRVRVIFYQNGGSELAWSSTHFRLNLSAEISIGGWFKLPIAGWGE